MKISEALLPEFDQESGMTKSVLERCPEAKFNFKPHAKSWDLISLANHLANLPTWSLITMKQDIFDIAPPGAPPYKEELAKTTAELVNKFVKNTADARLAIAEASDEDFAKIWTMLKGGEKIFSMPKNRLHAFVHIESQHFPSRTAGGLSTFDRCSGAGTLWAIGR